MAIVMVGPWVEARSLEIEGKAGYLSEWELSGAMTRKGSPGGREFSGRLAWKHVGICSVSGPQERSGDIDLRIRSSGSSERIEATLSFDGARCTYSQRFSGTSSGYMECSGGQSVPLSISIR
jgi:hypothetical protein